MSRGVTVALCALGLAMVFRQGETLASASENLVVAPGRAPAVNIQTKEALMDDGQIAVRPDRQGPDESALRYYASKNQTARVEIETQRLQTLYPSWKPPNDLYSTAASPGGDESALWALFAANKLDELRAAIAQRVRQEPGWRPSTDLEQKLRGKETRLNVTALWKEGRWRDLILFVKSGAYDSGSADTETLWTVAEAYAKAKQTSDAVAIYKSILTSDNDPQERLATFQKAMATLRMSDVEPLLAMARKQQDGTPEYAPIMIDIIRARIGSYLHDERSEEIPADQLHAFEDYARTATQPNQAGLVAWYYFRLKAYESALEWFKLALAHGGDAMIAHGLANSLQGLGYDRQAEEVAYAWRKPLVNNDIFFVDAVERELTKPAPDFIEPARLVRYAQVTVDTQSGEGAQALAWYAYNTCQFDVALDWFQRAVAWHPKETSVRGYALALQRLHKSAAYYALMNRYDGLFPQVLDLLFPDGSRHAPTLCERRPPGIRHGPPVRVSSFIVPGSAEKSDEARRILVAPESRLTVLTHTRSDRMPKIDRAEFPVSTEPQNPLRSLRALDSPAKNFGLSYFPEPSHGPWPVVAHRVPGVGPMPYERYGFMLLPGWNGVTEATWPPYSAQPAPPGTLWARETQSPVQIPIKSPASGQPVDEWMSPVAPSVAPAAEITPAAPLPKSMPAVAVPAPPDPAPSPQKPPLEQLTPEQLTPEQLTPEQLTPGVPASSIFKPRNSSRSSWDSAPVDAIEDAPKAPPPILAGEEAPPFLLKESDSPPQIAAGPEAPLPILASPEAPPINLAATDEPPAILAAPSVAAPPVRPSGRSPARRVPTTAVRPRWSVSAALAAVRQFRQGAIE